MDDFRLGFGELIYPNPRYMIEEHLGFQTELDYKLYSWISKIEAPIELYRILHNNSKQIRVIRSKCTNNIIGCIEYNNTEVTIKFEDEITINYKNNFESLISYLGKIFNKLCLI